MLSGKSFDDAVSQLAAQSDAIGRLAQDSGGFAAVVAAFESKDPDAFRWILGRLELLPHCELICEWLRIKLGVLRCFEVCGVVPEAVETTSLQAFAGAVVKLASNEEKLRRVVDAVTCGDAHDYHAVIDELELREFCHLLCQWVGAIIYERVCEMICVREPVLLPDPVAEIRAAAKVLAELLRQKKALNSIAVGAAALDCETVTLAVAEARQIANCETICRVICTWHRAFVCREICKGPVEILTGTLAVQEAQRFAVALRQLSNKPRVLGDLVTAVQSRNARTYSAIVERFGLGPYCHQLCAWVSTVTCAEFCSCVCPPGGIFPWFTSIGTYDYGTHIDSELPATGLTVGGTQAFYSTVRLNGFLTQTLGGQPLEYCFEYLPLAAANTTLAAGIGVANGSLSVASSAGFPAAPFNIVLGSASGAYEIITVTGVSGTTWTVTRGQQGTIAAAANAGARIITGASASGVWTQVPTDWIARTVVGKAEAFVPLPLPHVVTVNYTVNGISPDIAVPFTADGWIPVPQGADIAVDGDYLINLDTTQLTASVAADETGVSAGNSVNISAPTDVYFGLRMRVRQHGSTTSTVAGICNVVALDNKLYNNINHHPAWGGFVSNGAGAVCMVDIKELQGVGAGCSGITDSLTVLFTASHPNLGIVTVNMVGGPPPMPVGGYAFTLPAPAATGDWYGVAEPNGWTLATLKPCAYLVTVTAPVLLTTGDPGSSPTLTDQIAFCLT
jgi:hypothetical protein